jgi:hypothetical protein
MNNYFYHYVDKISILDVKGTFRDPSINISAFYLGAGNFGSIVIDGVDCNFGNNYAGADYYGDIIINNNVQNLIINNVKRNNFTDNRPSIKILGGANIGVMTCNNINAFIPNDGVTPLNDQIVEINGNIENLIFNNVNSFRDPNLTKDGSFLYLNGGKVENLEISNLQVKGMEDVVVIQNGGYAKRIIMNNINDASGSLTHSLINLNNNLETLLIANNILEDSSRNVVKLNGTSTLSKKSSIKINCDCGLYSNSNQSIASGAYTKINFAEAFDNFDSFDSTNMRFYAKEQGMFDFNLILSVINVAVASDFVIAVYMNETVLEYIFGDKKTVNSIFTANTKIYMNKGTYVDFRFYSSTNVTLEANKTLLNISKIN